VSVSRHARSLPRLRSATCWTGAGLLLSTLLLILAQLTSPVFAEVTLPTQTGRITDEAGLLSAEDKSAIEEQLKSLEGTSTDQVAVVTVNSLQGMAIEEYGLEVGRKWGIGQKDKDNGIVLIVAPNERKVRIEVGRRLEAQMPDAMAKVIIDNAILPKFRRGDFSGGVRDGVRDIKDVLLGDAEAVKDRAKGGSITTQGPDYEALIFLAIWIAIVAYVLYQQSRQARQLPQDMKRRRRSRWDNGGGVIVIPGGSGGWSGNGGDFGGGGGWSGGGGDFGGGGASGNW
jgi:uncharacterized protein